MCMHTCPPHDFLHSNKKKKRALTIRVCECGFLLCLGRFVLNYLIYLHNVNCCCWIRSLGASSSSNKTDLSKNVCTYTSMHTKKLRSLKETKVHRTVCMCRYNALTFIYFFKFEFITEALSKLKHTHTRASHPVDGFLIDTQCSTHIL